MNEFGMIDEKNLIGKALFGLKPVKQVLHTVTILQEGWEYDNKGWIVELDDGTQLAITTNHGGACLWKMKDVIEKLEETEKSAADLREAIRLILADSNK